jgi:polar amino acid transport system substrate-binding protein
VIKKAFTMKQYAVLCLYICLIFAGAYILWRLLYCTACQPIGDTIIIGTNAEYPPFSFLQNNSIVGFDIDVATEVAQRLGKKVELIDMPFDMLLPSIQLGRIHIIAAGISPKPTRAKHVLFSKPYLENDPLIIVSLIQKPITTVAALAGKTVVVNDGYTADSYISSQPTIIVQRLATPAEALLALQAGRADAYVAAHSSIQRFLKTHRHEYATHPIPDTSDAYALVISPQYPELLPLVQHALNGMQRDGTLDALKQKWGL